MSLDANSARFLLNQKRREVSLGTILTLGRQSIYMPSKQYRSHLGALKVLQRHPDYADDFFLGQGATSLDFMDASNYEGANIVHDLNHPIDAHLRESYDCVFDGGALEHVFNFPTALKNCMEKVRPGGHLIIVTTWNNYSGHGFYQFSPELFYSALSPANGYSVEQMHIVQQNRWYSVSGDIRIDGQNIAKVTQESLRRTIALVPQEPILFHRSLADNIAYGRPDATLDEIREAAREAYAADFIERLPQGYDTLVGERGIKLSGGERQRVAIARALLADCPILILDEATSSLDSVSEHYIQKALDRLMEGRTTITIAHRLATIQKADRILVFADGRIVEQGTHTALLQDPLPTYRRLYDMPALNLTET